MKYHEFVKMNEQGNSHWWYASRRKLLNQQLKKLSCGSRNLKILDLASACGDNFLICSNYGNVFGIDVSSYAIRYCKDKGIKTIVQGDAQKLPFKSNSYNVVLALDVFEHLKDDFLSLKEISRVLKNDGMLIFNVPAFNFLYSYHDKAFEHLRRYNTKEIKKKINSINLKVGFMTYWSFFIFPAVFIFRKILCREKNKEMPLSDFHVEVNPIIDGFLKLLFSIELLLIKMNISLPFGVSLFGVAKK